jgi:hypothetical protein
MGPPDQSGAVGLVVVTRQSGWYRDGWRAYDLKLDGMSAGRVRAGETVEFAALAGAHTLQARLDWSGSKAIPFELNAGETVYFEVHPAGNAFLAPFQMWGRSTWIELGVVSRRPPN